MGKYTVDVEADGHVTSAKFEGSTAKDIGECLSAPKDKALKGYDAAPGKITCDYSVTHTSYSSDSYKNWTFVPR